MDINKAQLSITANDCSVKTGSALPALTYTVTGLVNGDTPATAVSGSPQMSTSAASTAKPGSYPIVAASGTLKASNYVLAFSNGKLTVTQ